MTGFGQEKIFDEAALRCMSLADLRRVDGEVS